MSLFYQADSSYTFIQMRRVVAGFQINMQKKHKPALVDYYIGGANRTVGCNAGERVQQDVFLYKRQDGNSPTDTEQQQPTLSSMLKSSSPVNRHEHREQTVWMMLSCSTFNREGQKINKYIHVMKKGFFWIYSFLSLPASEGQREKVISH